MKTETNNNTVLEKDNFLEDLNQPVQQNSKADEVKASKEFYEPVGKTSDISPTLDHPVEETKENPLEEGPLFNQNVSIEKPNNNNGLVSVDLMGGNLPDLDDMDVVPLDLVGNYWTPEMPGESKRAYFDGLQISQFKQPEEEDVVIELETAYFYAKDNGRMVKFCNASKLLVAALKQAHIERGTPILITFMGKKKNSTNQFKSDVWSVKPLMLKVK